MDATVIQVMEAWPLQLALQTATGREDRALSVDAQIWQRDTLVDPEALRPGQRVQLLKLTSLGEIAELKIID